MSEARFKVLFSGELVPGAQLEVVQANLARLFKADPARIAALFSGKPVEIKRGLSEAQAEHYLKALHQAGANARKVAELSTSLSLQLTDDHPAAQTSAHAAGQAPRMTCPKCGHQQTQTKECSACGIIIDKYLARQTALAPSAAAAATPYATPQAKISAPSAEFDTLKVFTSDGRIGRMRYWVWSATLLTCLLPAALALVMAIKSSPLIGGLLSVAAVLVFGAMSLIISIKRLHDLGWSGWLWLLNFVPVLGSFFSLILLILPGNSGPNQFGPPPPENSPIVKILFWLWLVLASLGIVAAIMLPGALGLLTD
ncbi:DUF805 domain-containing protein [Pseudomonas sp. 5P_3.1_Bac2]|uniref:DUF805 domain-containing protein n=1 Tax=Pseudomonas sp. 5P_3.1_Bac2 TaxID=2971617 RepID=UPI0021C639BA|nr:DUF805 domain-containing protein [Pseudomonas sp. 5P_3.1_Bac2]MCU1717499.1 DUF805 domain-containing protein [Pseudomonas sp. 5P_3.1_Bac2]